MGSLLMLIVITVSVGFAAWLLFLWAAKSGQFDDMEGPKYRMLDDEDAGAKKKDSVVTRKND
jgi:cbb3-type cytochrome oxidase maturation protein